GAGLDQELAVVFDDRTRRLRRVRELQRLTDVLRTDAVGVHALGLYDHAHDVAWAANRIDVARPRNALQFDFGRVRDLLELVRAAIRIRGPERQRDDRHVVDAAWLDDRLADAEIRRQPVAMREDGVVQQDQ